MKTATHTTTTEKVTIPVRGTDTIAKIAEAMGAEADGHSYVFNVKIEVVGTEIIAKAGASRSRADDEAALAQMTSAEKKAVAKFIELSKAAAAARVDGQEIVKKSWAGFVKG
jgi:hypothetical protein